MSSISQATYNTWHTNLHWIISGMLPLASYYDRSPYIERRMNKNIFLCRGSRNFASLYFPMFDLLWDSRYISLSLRGESHSLCTLFSYDGKHCLGIYIREGIKFYWKTNSHPDVSYPLESRVITTYFTSFDTLRKDTNMAKNW